VVFLNQAKPQDILLEVEIGWGGQRVTFKIPTQIEVWSIEKKLQNLLKIAIFSWAKPSALYVTMSEAAVVHFIF